jgi:hypothetical protein
MNKKINLWNDNFGLWLNLIALIIIISSILFFWSNNSGHSPQAKDLYPTNNININISEKDKTEISKLIKLLNKKNNEIVSIKKDIELKEKKNSDELKYYSTLIGFILSIVGFFGFKSIHDTRQSAIERAVFDAKTTAESKAKEIAELEAKKISREVASEVAEGIAKTESEKITKAETKKYFDERFNAEMTNKINAYYDNRESRLTTIEEEIDKLKRPEAWGLKTEDEFEKSTKNKLISLDEKYFQILQSIHDLKRERDNG